LVEGKGEEITPLKILSPTVLLLVKPQVSVSTAWAYTRFDPDNEKLTKKPVDIKLFCQALGKGDLTSPDMILHNDFEDVVMSEYPVVREIKHRLLEMGAVISAMSGSGSTVFGVFRSKVAADKAAQSMKTVFCRVVETIV
jgi:4-diphosphocytidyl-2-C-methyl-D-erythritol kinase